MSRTYDLADKLIYFTMTYLAKHGSVPLAELFQEMKKNLKFNEWESVIYPINKTPRWERMTVSFSVDLTKAEWITKKRKIWTITPKGRKALEKLKEPSKLRIEAKRMFDIWNAIPREKLLEMKAEAKNKKKKK